jgi:hypothetical protein
MDDGPVSADVWKTMLTGERGLLRATTTGYPYVLVRLDAVDPVELSELIEDAWRLRAPKRVIKAFDAAQRAS